MTEHVDVMNALRERGLPTSEYASVADELLTGRARPEPLVPLSVEELNERARRVMIVDAMRAQEQEQ
jgi:hypothetical protein